MLGEQLGLPDERRSTALGSAVRAVGRARAGPASWRATRSRCAARIAQLAEFVEVAHRVGGVDAARALARKRARHAVRSRARALLVRATPRTIFAGLDDVGTWDAVIDAEPALAVVLSGERFDAALDAIADFVDLKSPYTLGHARAVADLAADAGDAARASARRGATRCGAPASCTASAGSASRTRSGTSAGRSARASGSACACTRTSPSGCCSSRRRSRRSARSPCSSASASTARATRAACSGAAISPAGADPRRGRRLPGDARAAAAPPGARAPTTRPRSSAPRCARAGSTATPSEAVLSAAGHRVPPAARGPGGPHRARGRGAAAARAGPVQQGDRRSGS